MQAGPAPVLEGTSEEWSGEAYEEDKAGAFLKFCAQVQHVPQQCVRYRYVSHHADLNMFHMFGFRLSVAVCEPRYPSAPRCNAETVFHVAAMSSASAEYMCIIYKRSIKLC